MWVHVVNTASLVLVQWCSQWIQIHDHGVLFSLCRSEYLCHVIITPFFKILKRNLKILFRACSPWWWWWWCLCCFYSPSLFRVVFNDLKEHWRSHWTVLVELGFTLWTWTVVLAPVIRAQMFSTEVLQTLKIEMMKYFPKSPLFPSI